MSNIIPIRTASRADVDETAVVEQLEEIPGEVDVDRVIKARMSAEPIVERITQLEDCLWAAAQELLRLDPRSALAERAKLLLKDRLEM